MRHPFFPERPLPIVSDDAVDPEFGTGAVKLTPAHDPVDFEIAERHDLAKINILDGSAHLTAASGRFEGLDRYEARRVILDELTQLGLVEEVERPYVHPVGHCDRCGTEVEPWLSEQWFVRMQPLVGPAVEAVRDGRIRMEPPRFRRAYEDWMLNIRDWCISRQLWWGHRIPVWYCSHCGKVFASVDEPDRCVGCGSGEIRQDQDVLDTWFSSQLWPFSTLGWPSETEDLSYFYPTTLMAPGYEILYLWVARMIVSGLYFMGDVPFRSVMIHGIVRDFEGKKMSKSKGNVIDPLSMIERYGADALRFSLAFAAVPGHDTNASEDRIEGARNFANKLWNASRFVLMSLGDERPLLDPTARDELGIKDRWILGRLDATIEAIEEHLDAFNWAEALRSLHRFVWSEYCDWYIELAKLDLASDRAEPARAVLLHVLDRILRLLHPVMPFITEELWSMLRPGEGSIMKAAWPTADARLSNGAEATMNRFQELVTALRRMKIEYGIPPAKRIPVTVVAGAFTQELEALQEALSSLARLESIEFRSDVPSAAGRARVLTPSGLEASVVLEDVIDRDAERLRLRKRIEDTDRELERFERKLGNSEFVSKAPAAVVEKERARLEEARAARGKLEEQLRNLSV